MPTFPHRSEVHLEKGLARTSVGMEERVDQMWVIYRTQPKWRRGEGGVVRGELELDGFGEKVLRELSDVRLQG